MAALLFSWAMALVVVVVVVLVVVSAAVVVVARLHSHPLSISLAATKSITMHRSVPSFDLACCQGLCWPLVCQMAEPLAWNGLVAAHVAS